MKVLAVFLFLQLMDIATTLAAIAMGGTEQNPLVGHFMSLGPVAGLLVSKFLVVALAAGFVWMRKTRAVRLANLVFALIIAWNLTIICRLALLA